MRVLNLYSGLGGNRLKWENCTVTAVEMEKNIANIYKAQFPNDTVIIGDAHQYLLDHYDEYDFIWTSPPCQTHSKMMKASRHKADRYPDMALYQEIIFLSNFFKGKWVVENVKPYYEPLIKPAKTIGRHLFWGNISFENITAPEQPKGFIKKGTVQDTNDLKEWLGIKYDGNVYYKDNHCPGQVLRNCVHPDLGLQVFNKVKPMPTRKENHFAVQQKIF